MKLKIVSCCVVLATGSSLIAQHPTSVAAVRLGMSEREVKAAVGLEFVESFSRKPPVPGEPYASALIRHPEQLSRNDVNHESYTLEYIDDKVVYIDHENRWAQNKPNYLDTGRALLAKWGSTTVLWRNPAQPQNTFQWKWKPDQSPIVDDYVCSIDFQNNPMSYDSVQLLTPRKAGRGCGVSIYAEMGASPDGYFTNSLSIQMLDNEMLLRGVLHVKDRMEKEKQDQINGSKKNVAPI